MFEEVICRSCDGNGCINCDGNGIRYIEIDDPTLALQDEISDLKEALETSKNEFKILLEASNNFAKSKDEVRLWNENESLKKKLKIAVDAFIDIDVLCSEGSFEERRILYVAHKALEEIESAGE